MAHEQQRNFCQSVKQAIPSFFINRFVVDIGSLDINGNNNYLFEDCLYIGIDLLPGRNVDICCKCHELNLPSDSIDVVISTECFEHDKFYDLTLKNIARILKPGGLLLFTCAFTGRQEHGTRRTSPEDAPFIQEFNEWSDYYKNLDEGDIRRALNIDAIFQKYEFSFNITARDLYFWGIKRGVLIDRCDYSFQIQMHNARSDLKARETFVAELVKLVNGCNEQIADLTRLVAERDAQIANLNRMLIEREAQIGALNQPAAEHAQGERQSHSDSLDQG